VVGLKRRGCDGYFGCIASIQIFNVPYAIELAVSPSDCDGVGMGNYELGVDSETKSKAEWHGAALWDGLGWLAGIGQPRRQKISPWDNNGADSPRIYARGRIPYVNKKQLQRKRFVIPNRIQNPEVLDADFRTVGGVELIAGEANGIARDAPQGKGEKSDGECAMCGRLPVGKGFLHVCSWVGAAMCSAYLGGSHDRWP
jgi:hypothetical protein